MSLAIVRSNCLLIHGLKDKETRTRQNPEMADEAVMAMLAP